jgi:nucleotide-binding universal stress UspA family protein
MHTILVPLDGSALAEQVLPYVRSVALTQAARVHLFRVVVDTADASTIVDAVAATYGTRESLELQQARLRQAREALYQQADDYLEARATHLQGAGLEVTWETGVGKPAEGIIEAATTQHATLIAMASHGYSGLQRWALGSVADKVIHATATPVLIVRGAHSQAGDVAIKRILVPLDGSTLARQALPFATNLARSAQAELLLLEAVAPTLEVRPGVRPLGRTIPQLAGMTGELAAQAQQELDALAGELRREQLAVRPLVVPGYAAEAIVDGAVHYGVDLIVMATHGYSGLRRWALGSVADKVLYTTTIPLVLVR